MINTGNISARYTPTAAGLPENWTHYFVYPTGAGIGSSGVELLPGESREFDLKVLIDENASQGNIPVTVNVTSNQYPDIEDGLQSIVKILRTDYQVSFLQIPHHGVQLVTFAIFQ